jgi:hypothetical protein
MEEATGKEREPKSVGGSTSRAIVCEAKNGNGEKLDTGIANMLGIPFEKAFFFLLSFFDATKRD